ncbi:MAG TPA: hypothetical protein DEZ08_06320 [Dehalococcoidia bacterium]|nr:hypothetical protein [Dehalococcoidia bacterium]
MSVKYIIVAIQYIALRADMEKLLYQSPGITKYDLDTPALMVDIDLVDKNIQTYHAIAATKHVSVLAYPSIHGSLAITKRQLNATNVLSSICCNSISEIEAFQSLNISDVILKNTPVTPSQAKRLSLLTKIINISIVVTHQRHLEILEESLGELTTSVGILLHVNCGDMISGIQNKEQLKSMVDSIKNSKKLNFIGLSTEFSEYKKYTGINPLLDANATTNEPNDIEIQYMKLLDFASAVPVSGYLNIIVFGENNINTLPNSNIITAIVAGCYPIPDINALKSIPQLIISASVLSQIISKAPSNYIVIDSGHKTYGTDLGLPTIYRDPSRPFTSYLNPEKFSAEHGCLSFPAGNASDIEIKSKIELIPQSMELCINQFDFMRFITKGIFTGYMPIVNRGQFS